MVEKLIAKVLKDSEKKSKNIAKEAEEKLNRLLPVEKEKINKEFEERLMREKQKIQQEIEAEKINFRLEKEKEILSLKNRLIEETIKKMEVKFNKYLHENFEEILKKFVNNIGKGNYTIKIPAGIVKNTLKNLESDEIDIIEDNTLKNCFKIEGKNWETTFGWENIKLVFHTELTREIAGELFK